MMKRNAPHLQPPWRVLLIDDDAEVLNSLQKILMPVESKSASEDELDVLIGAVEPQKSQLADLFQCDLAAGGEAGLGQIVAAREENNPFAVACIDMRMHNGWDGLETAEKIRAQDPLIHIIFVTAWMDYSLDTLQQKIGFEFSFLSKPVRRNEFLQQVIFSAQGWSDACQVVEDKKRISDYHQQVTQSLAMEKEHIELVFESMREAVVMVDRFGNIEGFNPKLSEITGWEEEDLAGQPLDRLFVGRDGDCPKVSSGLHVHSTQTSQERLELVVRSIDRWIDASVLPVMLVSADSRVVQSNHAMELLTGWSSELLVGNTLEPLLPEAMRGHHHKLVESFIHAPAMRRMGGERQLPVCCRDGSIQPFEIALLPIQRAGESMVVVVLHDPEDQQKLDLFKITPLGSLFAGESGDEGIETDWMLKCRDAEPVPVHVAGSPIYRDWEGRRRFNGSVLVLRDLRALIAAEATRRASAAKDEFLASMSHELRTPLSAIIGNSELLRESISDQLTASQQDMLRSIEVSGKTQLALVNDILDLSKIGAGKFEIDEHDFDLNYLMRDIEDIFSMRARSEKINFQICCAGEVPERQLIGDRKSIAQVLINLLSNAFKFTEEGDVTLTITPNLGQGTLSFQVEDQGIGMSPEVLDRLFQPFEQADRTIARRFGGTGLGLHISWSLVELMHGTIQVESREGEGSSFTVTLPCQQGAQPLESEAALGSPIDMGEGRFRGRVLIAEDTPDLQALERNLLEAVGLEVEVVSNGEEALAAAIAQTFDLILMDMQMPVMDGVEATRMLREVNNATPVVALTANVMRHHREQFLQAGCNDFLSKPIDRKALMLVLKKFLPLLDEGLVEDEEAYVVDAGDELMGLFFQRAAEVAQELEEALEQGALQPLFALAHIVKGNASTFGYPDVSRLAGSVCDAVHAEDQECAVQFAGELRDRLKQISVQP